MIDFEGINAAALGNAEGILQNWLPDGKRNGREWVCRNPKRADNRAGSFSVNLHSGVWADFATGEGGGDLIALYAFLNDCEQGQAARAVADELRMTNPIRKRERRPKYQPAKQNAPQAHTAPLKAKTEPKPAPEIRHYKLGAPAFAWEYRNEAGQATGYACRYEDENGKQVLPFSWTGEKWEWRAMPEPRPLYNLPRVLNKPQAVVIIAEGEKAADAAQGLFPEGVAATWAGGCKAWHKTDWQPLKGRAVIFWPDNDRPGQTVAADVQEHLLGLGAKFVKVIALPFGLPQGWDAADAVAEGWTRGMALELLAGFPNTPEGLCPLCWLRSVVAPVGGPTCKHTFKGWPETWPANHEDFCHGPRRAGD
ncbi:hypothetical protein G0Q06_02190 [Puniceicoccales bacterium CK1056]|uniref:Toprim domain-containing protein n=1 Tax=Oceanipulchritudo coccoides TaxID=2706888 RepID=A0A6B2LYX1_9BACT|nr:hypothetical protein [Oceanipulchritudo coccoides]NDV61256.1 hypothetical protein [Oceanipulchritudo coccoides]